jgi:predicted phage tail protein
MYSGSGGSGGDSPRTPVESPDSLVNISYARILDLVSEGEIKGLVDGASSIFLNGTPAKSSGINTFAGFTYAERAGTQSQTYVDGFPQVENNISVGAEIRSDIPYVRAITNSAISSVRVNIGAPRLAKQITSGDKQGDTVGYRVSFRIDVDDGAGIFTDIGGTVFDGKTTTGYQRSVLINLPRTVGTRRIRIRRITGNASLSSVSDTTNIVSVTEIIDAKLRYPNSAYYAVRFDAQTFGGQIPSRSYLLDGRIISVPTNYDPVARTYDGVWDGTFKQAYSNNPAWVYYDLLLHHRYGLGSRVSGADIDKWSLYEISRYCDQMVDDGKGGLEPRYTCNCYLQSAADALKVLQDLASAFRGITLWGAGSAYVRADMPRDPIYTYTNANVIDGKFVYKGSPKSTRYSVVDIGWNDPTDQYKIKVERVQHPLAFARYGFQPTNATAFACTSQGQAIRLGKHILETNFSESNMVSFSTGLDAIHCMPGDVIRIADNFRAGRRLGGRVLSNTVVSITCDKVEGVSVGSTVYIAKAEGGLFEREVTAVIGNVISFDEALDSDPVPMAIYSFDHDDVVSQLFRVVSISDNEDGTYSFSCAAYNPNKYDYIDNDIIISQKPITALPLAVQATPSNLAVESSFLIDQYQAVTKMTISWDKAEGAIKYVVEWRRDDNNWVPAGETYNTEIDVYGIYDGAYDIRVKAIGPTNIHSVWETIYDQLLEGKTLNVDAITSINTVSEIFAITVRWQFPAGATDSAYTELEYSEVSSGSNPTAIRISYPTDEYTHSGMGAARTLYFRARLIDKSGNSGPWSAWVQGISSSDSTEILEYLVGQITETELGENLLSEIDKISGNGAGSVNERIDEVQQEVDGLQDQINELVNAPDWTNTVAWLAGSLVNHEDRLYSAKIDVPIGIDILNATYWEDIGAFSSLGEAVASLNIRMDDAETEIDEVTGIATANARSLETLSSAYRDDNGEGELADALRGWDSQASFAQEITTRATADEAEAQRTTLLEARTTAGEARLATVETTVVSNNTAITMRVDLLTADVNGNSAAILNEQTARADADSALASDITSLEATVGDNTAAIQVNATTTAGIQSGLAAMYSVKLGVTVGGQYYAAGMGIGIENTPAGMQSQVIFLADRFSILHSTGSGATPVAPFIVVEGQTIINNAVIGEATISFAKISDTLQSDNYVANTSGWSMKKDGGLQLNGSVSGTGSTTIDGAKIIVRDGAGTMRVRIGVWT